MLARRPRARLIFSALLGALVISCGGPPIYVVAPPAPVAAPGPQGGLQEAAPPAQAPAPPPKAVPPPVAALPPGRPGGAPPGTELVTVPGGQVPLTDWMDLLAEGCKKANYGPRCLKLDISYKDTNGQALPKNGSYENCEVKKQKPNMGDTVPAGSSVRLTVVNCDPPAESKKPAGSSNTDTGTTPGHQGK